MSGTNLDTNLARRKLNIDYDQLMKPLEWVDKIPYIQFPKEWEVQIIPPFNGALVRFRVKDGDSFISVYLDGYNLLGYESEPYWEVYPYKHDTFRCRMNETDKLIEAIKEILNS